MKLVLQFEVAAPLPRVWAAMADVPLIAACVPGATLIGITPEGLHTGRVTVKVGPVTANFTGQVALARDEERKAGRVTGQGRDGITASSARAEMRYRLQSESNSSTLVVAEAEITLTGVLANFGKSAVINDIATRIAQTFAANLTARLGQDLSMSVPSPVAAVPLRAGRLLFYAIVASVVRMIEQLLPRRLSK